MWRFQCPEGSQGVPDGSSHPRWEGRAPSTRAWRRSRTSPTSGGSSSPSASPTARDPQHRQCYDLSPVFDFDSMLFVVCWFVRFWLSILVLIWWCSIFTRDPQHKDRQYLFGVFGFDAFWFSSGRDLEAASNSLPGSADGKIFFIWWVGVYFFFFHRQLSKTDIHNPL